MHLTGDGRSLGCAIQLQEGAQRDKRDGEDASELWESMCWIYLKEQFGVDIVMCCITLEKLLLF